MVHSLLSQLSLGCVNDCVYAGRGGPRGKGLADKPLQSSSIACVPTAPLLPCPPQGALLPSLPCRALPPGTCVTTHPALSA